MVDSNGDADDGDYGAGRLSLREAVRMANARPGADVITFATTMSGQTIALNGTELHVTGAVTIDAAPLAANVVINAGGESRVFRFGGLSIPAFAAKLAGLTLTGGRTTASNVNGSGGAIGWISPGTLTLEDSVVTGSSTAGEFATGGGVHADNLVLIRTTISDNSTTGLGSSGGGVYAHNAEMIDSTISGNSTSGGSARGGGAWISHNLSLVGSTVSGNETTGAGAEGGGLNTGPLTMRQSTVSGNSTGGANATGGGIWLNSDADIRQSTITENRAALSGGGGIFQRDRVDVPALTLINTILSNNTAASAADLLPDPGGARVVLGSLIGTALQPTMGSGNIRTNNPQLAPLALNGGWAPTHQPLPGSPAIDAGRVLDDYTANSFALKYNFVPLFGAASNNPQVVDGEARLNVGADRAAAFVWNQGERLSAVGDQASVSFGLKFPREANGSLNDHSSAGLALYSTVTGGPLLAEIRLNASLTDPNGGQLVDGANTIQVSGSVAGTLLLTVRVVSVGSGTMTIESRLAGPGIQPVALTRTISAVEAFFGPVAFNVQGDGSRHDNLTFSPALDQRAGQRVLDGNGDGGARIDIGAVEASTPLVVDTTTDLVDGDYRPGQLSLREAIELANNRPGADFIAFAPAMSGQTIVLGGAQLVIAGELTIDAAPLAVNVTIDGNLQSRIFNVDGPPATLNYPVTLAGLNLVRGRTTGGNDGGGAVRSASTGLLTLRDSAVIGNATAGPLSDGGGILARGDATLVRTTVAENSTSGQSARGGGVTAIGTLTLDQSTVSNNSTTNLGAVGGGVRASNLIMLLSTLSGNRAQAAGGGAHVQNALIVRQSTITANSSTQSAGGGLHIAGNAAGLPAAISGSIVSANSAVTDPDVRIGPQTALAANNSVLGTAVVFVTGDLNIVTDNPLVGPLAANGGPTRTHALLPGSPALDAGDPNRLVNLARGGGASQSSEYASPFPADLAIDGITSSFTHTASADENAAWEVTLAEEFAIGRVVILNRAANRSRLRDITVEVLDSGGKVVARSPLLNPENEFGGGLLDAGPAQLIFNLVTATGGAVTGRTVRISRAPDPDLSGSGGLGNPDEANVLSLAEVLIDGVDQRSANRVADGDGNGSVRIDIGAQEAQIPSSADFDANMQVDGNDFLAWQRGLGTPFSTRAMGNSDDDLDTDASDLAAWRSQYGAAGLATAASDATTSAAATAGLRGEAGKAAIDALFAGGDFTSLFAPQEAWRPVRRLRLR